MAPFEISTLTGSLPYYLIFLFIGIAFGAVLEMSGFGDSRKLAAQFYLKDLTVLKVMFTAIVVAAVLIFTSSAFGLLDFSRLWVNPTYLMPGIIGGLIMGVGFIVGGFCPGTSAVAAATLKLDGIAFVIGVGLGTLLFGETAGLLGGARFATFGGRYTLDELFNLPIGVVVVLLVIMALMMFWAAELAEKHFGRGQKISLKGLLPSNRKYITAASALVVVAFMVAVIGQPKPLDNWKKLFTAAATSLDNREPYIHPAEVVEWRQDDTVYVRVLDVRTERDFNQFHLQGAINISLDILKDKSYLKMLKTVPDNMLTFVVSNDETWAAAGWKQLVGAGFKNVYIIDGGINNWLKVYPTDPCIASPITKGNLKDEQLAYRFQKAIGDNCYSSHPEVKTKKSPTECDWKENPKLKEAHNDAVIREIPFDVDRKITFERKVKMQKNKSMAGGCG